MKKIEKANLLYIVYAIMVVVFIGLTIGSDGVDASSLFINFSMFVIVFLIFFRCMKNMKKIQDMTEDLNQAVLKIDNDYQDMNTYLWNDKKEIYLNELFVQQELREAYTKYGRERKRLAETISNNYKCNIDEYINESLIDSTMKKNVFNLVPGVMTGLGILGTFIGLSIGLQHFNTGNSEEIAASIAPLMNGIKVAFHTSIYGMMFSLSFNYIYKAILEDAYLAVDNFLDIFERYVDSDASSDNNGMVQVVLQKMPEMIGTQIAEILTPAVNRMNDTLENFTKNIADSQVKGVADIVDHFMEVMNESFANSFVNLRETLDETCTLQRQSGEMMTGILDKIKSMTGNIMSINELSNKTVENMAGYVSKVEELQRIINENFVSVNIQLEDQREYDTKLKEYLEILVMYERQIGEASSRFTEDMSKQIEVLENMENKISESTREHLEMLAVKADEYNKTLTEVAKQELQGVLSLADEYSGKIVMHLDNLDNMSDAITDKAKDSINQIADNAKHNNKLLEEMHSTFAKAAQAQLEEITSVAQKETDTLTEVSKGEIQAVVMLAEEYTGRIEKYIDKLNIMNSQLIDETTKNLAVLTAQAEKQMNVLLDVSNQHSGEMRDASKELVKVCEQLNNKLSESLKVAFSVIDENLADITRHLSGTIAEVDETTGRVPKVVDAAYDGMKNSFEEMKNKYNGLIDALEQLTVHLKKRENEMKY